MADEIQDSHPAPPPGDLRPRELEAWLASGAAPLLVDVREVEEWRICNLPGAELVPLRTLPARVQDLPTDRDLVLYCHSGARSAQAAHWLRKRGFERVYNLAGGIDAWARDIAPEMPRY